MSGIRRNISTVQRKISLPEELAGKVDLILIDPVRQAPRYGALSQLITELLQEWIQRIEENSEPNPQTEG